MNKTAIAIAAAIPVYAILDIYRYAFRRNRSWLSQLLLDKKEHQPDFYEWRDGAAEALRSKMHIRYTIQSERGETLQGYYFPCGNQLSKKIAFIVHGYHSEHAATAGMVCEYYHSRGFDVFTCDNTASGESGGHTFGYDVFESVDCLKWLDFLKQEFGSDIKVVMHGFSLGGATVLKMSDRYPDFVKFVVDDCGYIDARELIKKGTGPLYPIMYRLNFLFGGYDLADSDVSENIKNSKVPFLIMHGKKDETVPFSMAPRIYELCPNDKDCLFVDDVKHMECSHYAQADYEAKLDAFVAKYID